MLAERLSGADAVERIVSITACGCRVLGVDGFRVVPEGFEAALDLILDLSTKPTPRQQAAEEAKKFIVLHAADDVFFEVVFGN